MLIGLRQTGYPNQHSFWGHPILGSHPLDYDVDLPRSFGGLTAFVRPHRQAAQTRVLLLCHPLWTEDHDDYQQALAAARVDYPKAVIEPINPFLAVRRPAQYA